MSPGLTDRWPNTATAFLDEVFAEIAASCDRDEEAGNIDTAYPPDMLTLDQDSFNTRRAAYLSFIAQNYELLFRTFALLSDDLSRTLYIQLLAYRALGPKHVRLLSNNKAFWRKRDEASRLASTVSSVFEAPDDTSFRHFEIEHNGSALSIDCQTANVFFSFFCRQYYFQRDGLTIAPSDGDHVIDVGSCYGDTALAFASTVGPRGHIHTFDVVETHLRIVRHNIAQNPSCLNITIHPAALSDQDRVGRVSGATANPGFSIEGDCDVPLVTLDSLVEAGRIERVDFIKMDIEGHELAALRGAEAAIRRFRPKLAISIYHNWTDYFRLPAFVASLGCGYRFYLDNYTVSDGETILYCTHEAEAA